MTHIDYGRHSDDYATHRPGPPDSFYERLDRIAAIDGARALDLGTGPGTVALELARRGADVVGIDVAPEQISSARQVAEELELGGRTRFEVATAEDTGLETDTFGLVTACQCWHWFDGDAALAEARRVLRPGGVLAIVAYSYLAEHSPLASETEELILELNPSWNMAGWTGVFPAWMDQVKNAGLELIEAFGYDHPQPFSHDRWRGRMRTCNGVGSGDLSDELVQRFDDALADLLARDYPEPVIVPHRVWCVAARSPD